MRYYLIDEISPSHMRGAKEFLKKTAEISSLESLFWVRFPSDLLTEAQYAHKACQPHVFAVETGPNWIKFEFFVRTLSSMRCTCPAYCSRQQRDFVISFANSMIEELGIAT
jgi:hypothetical protein